MKLQKKNTQKTQKHVPSVEWRYSPSFNYIYI